MFLIELLQRVANRFHAAMHLLGNATRDFRWASAGRRQTASAADNFIALFIRHLAEIRSAANTLRILADKTLDGAAQKAQSLAALENKSPTHKALVSPARNGLGRNI